MGMMDAEGAAEITPEGYLRPGFGEPDFLRHLHGCPDGLPVDRQARPAILLLLEAYGRDGNDGCGGGDGNYARGLSAHRLRRADVFRRAGSRADERAHPYSGTGTPADVPLRV